MNRFSALFLLLSLLCLPASAQMYRWVDDAGRTHYTDAPPPPNAKDAERKRLGSNVVESGESYAAQHARKSAPVSFYTGKDCAACDEGRKLLQTRGIPFRTVDTNQPAGHEALKKLTSDTTIPVLAVGPNIYKGFDAGSWQKALDTAGYPNTPIGQAKPEEAKAASPVEAPAKRGRY